jgi:hypothetical protein
MQGPQSLHFTHTQKSVSCGISLDCTMSFHQQVLDGFDLLDAETDSDQSRGLQSQLLSTVDSSADEEEAVVSVSNVEGTALTAVQV